VRASTSTAAVLLPSIASLLLLPSIAAMLRSSPHPLCFDSEQVSSM
jgi:hypothetical protein